jgi:hypothetical protein
MLKSEKNVLQHIVQCRGTSVACDFCRHRSILIQQDHDPAAVKLQVGGTVFLRSILNYYSFIPEKHQKYQHPLE